jgi:hypothetical protein
MQVIEKIDERRLPFEWLDLEYLPNSLCNRREIYLKGAKNGVEGLPPAFLYLIWEI